MLERRDPFGRMLSLRQMMDRLMEDAFVMPRDALMSGLNAMSGGGQMDVYEEGDAFVVEAQLPGHRPEDIDISVERGTLTIRGESRAQEERKDRNYIVREQRSGSFQRSIQLPSNVDPDACQATFEHGILRLTIPRAEQAKPRRISIDSGGPGSSSGPVSVGGAHSTAGAQGGGEAQRTAPSQASGSSSSSVPSGASNATPSTGTGGASAVGAGAAAGMGGAAGGSSTPGAGTSPSGGGSSSAGGAGSSRSSTGPSSTGTSSPSSGAGLPSSDSGSSTAGTASSGSGSASDQNASISPGASGSAGTGSSGRVPASPDDA